MGMPDMTINEQLRLLSARGAHEELCALAREYLARSAEEQDADTAYAARVLLGETLLGMTAKSFDADCYIEGVHALMQAYNERGNAGIYDLLCGLSHEPNAAAMCANYEANRRILASMEGAPALPDYDRLPVAVFPLTNDYSVLFDKERQAFLFHARENALQTLYHTLIFSDLTHGGAAPCMERFSQDIRNDEISDLGVRLTEAVRMHKFGASMQECAEKYHRLYPYGELYEIFHAEAALDRQDIDAALRYGEAAYEKRKMSAAACRLLSRIYRAEGYLAEAIKFQVLSAETAQLSLPDDPVQMQRCLYAITAADTDMRYAPFVHRTSFDGTGIKSAFVVPVAEEVLRFSDDLPRYWAGIYNPYGQMHVKEKLLAVMNGAMEQNALSVYSDFTFDLMKAEEHAEIRIAPQEDAPVLVPIAAKEVQQAVHFQEPGFERTMNLSRGEFGFYRIEHPTSIRSDAPFAAGEPILLRHSPTRRKFVLNILADGLSWPEMRRGQYRLVPNLMKFFQKGVIFDNCFSGSEYTYPSLASIETGLYQHHTQIAAPGAAFVLAPSYATISEKMKSLGYYCVMLEGCSEGIYNGTFRGYDRLIVNPWVLRAADGVERMIRHLEAFGECDNFVLLHFADTHPNNFDVATPVKTQTHLPLSDVLQPQDMGASVFLKPNPLSQYVNHSEIRAADRQLGYLFDYIEQHYADDEYIVLLYSDHGASVHSRSPYLMSEEQTGAALMARGAGVPQLGRVDELASAVDIYKILGKLAGYPIDAPYLDGNLPEAFGGTRREYTVSNSIYPGQTYKICVRTERHAFHLETEEFTREDGTISLDRYSYHIHERDENYREVFDDALARYFLDIVRNYTESFRR
jgi:hypothetical protein